MKKTPYQQTHGHKRADAVAAVRLEGEAPPPPPPPPPPVDDEEEEGEGGGGEGGGTVAVVHLYTKGAWAEDEDERLEEAVAMYADNWTLVSDHVQTRTAAQCRHRYAIHPPTHLPIQ